MRALAGSDRTPALGARAADSPLAPDARVEATLVLRRRRELDDSTVHALRESFPEALSTDMESTALAHTCHLYGAPFLSVRGISDLCGPQAGTDFAAHVDDAAERSVTVAIGILHEMSTKR